MTAGAVDLGAYLTMISPPRSNAGAFHEIHYNTPPRQQPNLYNGENDEEFCTKSNLDECIQYMDKVSVGNFILRCN